jgi:hypothetical protein
MNLIIKQLIQLSPPDSLSLLKPDSPYLTATLRERFANHISSYPEQNEKGSSNSKDCESKKALKNSRASFFSSSSSEEDTVFRQNLLANGDQNNRIDLS